MGAAKGAAIDLLRDAYEHRDAVSLVAFAGDDAAVLLPPTDDVGRAARHLKELPTGDRTPLAAGVDAAADAIARADADASLAVVVTDGGANGAEHPTGAVRDAGNRLREVADRTLVVDAGEQQRKVDDVGHDVHLSTTLDAGRDPHIHVLDGVPALLAPERRALTFGIAHRPTPSVVSSIIAFCMGSVTEFLPWFYYITLSLNSCQAIVD
jgi:hypothetical protein